MVKVGDPKIHTSFGKFKVVVVDTNTGEWYQVERKNGTVFYELYDAYIAGLLGARNGRNLAYFIESVDEPIVTLADVKRFAGMMRV